MFNAYRVSNPNYTINEKDVKVVIVTTDEEKALILGSAKLQEYCECLDFWDPALLKVELIDTDLEIEDEYTSRVIID